ncbi:MAG: penicillin-binding protein [Dehalococcoidia bacterium]|nr:penicillin-binding protein [Dehalococcoidia bacterium]
MRYEAVVRRRKKQRIAQAAGGAGRPLVKGIVAMLGTLATAGVLLFLAVGGLAGGFYVYATKDLAPPEMIATRDIARNAKILDRKGRLLYEIFDPQLGRRSTVPLSEISPYLIQATIATEDASFYENQGVNIRGIARAMWSNVSKQEVSQGGSSITQQLVKNVFIPEEERAAPSILRKVKEVALSLELTRRFSKDQLLTYYFNELNYGNLSYGIETAAQSYFAKPAKDLGLAEASMLAGIPQLPAAYSPLLDPAAAKRRQGQVLDLMVRQNFITKAEADAAREEELEYRSAKFDIKAPHFVMYIRELLAEKYGVRTLFRSGLKVTTSLDLDLQQLGEEIIAEQVAKTARSINAHNAALTAIDPRTGEVLAMVGSADYFDPSIDGQVNIATSEKQPGSSFKPFNYVTAFMKGWNPATMLLDVPITIRDGINPPYSPNNFDKKFAGPVSIRQALSNSMNIPAIKTIEFVGVENLLDTAHKMGITTLNRKGWYGLSLTLGGGEVKLLDLTYAYSVFANLGEMKGLPVQPDKRRPGLRTLEPVVILKVEDADGRVLEEFKEPQTERIIPADYAYLIANILSDNAARAPIFGNSMQLRGSRPAAVKTGTTEDLKDFWTMGFTPELAVGVWMGNSDGKKLTGGFSGTTTGPIWERFMNGALEGVPVSEFKRPANIVSLEVCAPSGLLPTPECQRKRSEIFVQGQEPKDKDTLWRLLKLDRANGLLAGPNTPPGDIEEKAFLVLPAEAREWAEKQEIEQPPTQISNRLAPVTVPIIVDPAPGGLVRALVSIRGNAAGDDFESYVIEAGKGTAPATWLAVAAPRTTPISNGVLGAFDSSGLSGPYLLRLTVKRKSGKTEQSTVNITIDNTLPAVNLVTPTRDARFLLMPAQDALTLQADASDDNGVEKVDFYVDGNPVATAVKAPYNAQWKMTPGPHIVFAAAVDRAGNAARTASVTIQVDGTAIPTPAASNRAP